jgi:hypothetical protein
MTRTELTEDMITAAMAKADAGVCVGSDRCFALPDQLQDARQTCTPKAQCKVGGTRRVIIGRGGRESWDVCPEVSTGLVMLISQSAA